jgi:hypothetical protein
MCGTPVICPPTLGCSSAIAPHAKHLFAPNDVDDLRATLARVLARRATSAPTAAEDVARGAVLYDTSVTNHVNALLRAAQQIADARALKHRFADSRAVAHR